MNQIRQIPGVVDFRIQEPNNAPELDITMDRTKASILGMNEQSVANTVLGALAGSQQNPELLGRSDQRSELSGQRSRAAVPTWILSMLCGICLFLAVPGQRSDSGQCRPDFAQQHVPGH